MFVVDGVEVVDVAEVPQEKSSSVYSAYSGFVTGRRVGI